MFPMSRCEKHGICKHETKVVCSLCAAENSGNHPTDTQQLKAEIAEVAKMLESKSVKRSLYPGEMRLIAEELRKLSAV